MDNNLFEIPVTTISGEQTTLGEFGAKALLIVNTASNCGFTVQYEGLEQLWLQYRERGLLVLGFPCNQFGRQEPGDEAQIAQFCQRNYGVTFPLFNKIKVNGAEAHPLFVSLKKRAPGLLGSQSIKWNFTKFLLSGDARQIKRFAPRSKPEELVRDIQALLG